MSLYPFRYFGGKVSKLTWILPLLRAPDEERRYVEPFCGSSAVALNRNHPKPRLVFLNDIDGKVINFYECLRQNTELLTEQLIFTPSHEEEHRRALEYLEGWKYNPDKPDVEAARCFAVRIFQTFGGGFFADRSATWNPYSKVSDEAYAVDLREIARKIRHFHYHNDDALKIIKKRDKHGTFFYTDPPYLHSTRVAGAREAYANEPDDAWHERFLTLAQKSRGYFAISGYHSDLYDDMLAGWHVHEGTFTSSWKINEGAVFDERVEVLWTNYNPAEIRPADREPDLFDI